MKFNTNLYNALKGCVMNGLFRKRKKNGDLDMCVRKTLYKIQIKERFMNLSGKLRENS